MPIIKRMLREISKVTLLLIVFLACLQDPLHGQALKVTKDMVKTLPQGADRDGYEKAIKRMEEGLKMKNKTGSPNPRIIYNFNGREIKVQVRD